MQLKNYVSDFTQFIEKMKKDNPEIEKGQQKGHALLWDKAPINLNDIVTNKESNIPQKPYVYSNKFDD